MYEVFFIVGALSNGGAERAVSSISQHLPQSIKTHIVLFGSSERIDYPFRGDLIFLDQIKKSSKILKLFSIGYRIIRLNKLKSKNPHAVFISFLEYPSLINILSGTRARVIVSVRNHLSTKNRYSLKGKIWNLVNRLLYPLADRIIAVSEDVKKDLVEFYRIRQENVQVIYNSYDLDLIKRFALEPISPEWKVQFERPVLLTMGRLLPQKGHWHLIRVAGRLQEKYPDIQVVVLGEGPLKESLLKCAALNGLSDRFLITGFQKNPFPYISRSRIFVLPSVHEGFPNALVEAMACGIPVVATDCHSGPREILAPMAYNDTNIEYGLSESYYGGLIVPDESLNLRNLYELNESEQQLYTALDLLLSDQNLYQFYCNQSLRRVNDFEISQIIRQWTDLIISKPSSYP